MLYALYIVLSSISDAQCLHGWVNVSLCFLNSGRRYIHEI